MSAMPEREPGRLRRAAAIRPVGAALQQVTARAFSAKGVHHLEHNVTRCPVRPRGERRRHIDHAEPEPFAAEVDQLAAVVKQPVGQKGRLLQSGRLFNAPTRRCNL